jgi:ApbE superfamily uncharacterized protein (UPF0280 family)
MPLRRLRFNVLTRCPAVKNSSSEIRKRLYRPFVHKEAVFRICCERYAIVTAEIITQRRILERYIDTHPEFLRALEPVTPLSGAPEVARRMARAAQLTGVGPMAAVAGAMAQLVVEAAIDAGASEVIVENGGDIYIQADSPVTIVLHTGAAKIGDSLAFSIQPQDTPLAICSSSGKMGHSMSLGECDLATVVAKDAALADAAATLAANLVKTVDDVDTALEKIIAVEGIDGVLIVKDDRVGLAGKLPSLVKVKR